MRYVISKTGADGHGFLKSNDEWPARGLTVALGLRAMTKQLTTICRFVTDLVAVS